MNEDLRAWFGKGKSGGVGGGGWDRYNSSGDRVGKCGDAKEGDAYSACLSKEKARKLGKAGRAAFVNRKRAAQKKGGDAKKGGEQTKGQNPIKVKTGVNEAQGKTLHVYDFDDTLVKTNATVIVKKADGSEYELDSHGFATHKLAPGESYDFTNLDKIISGSTPILRNIKQIQKSLKNPNIKTTILTARRVAYPIMQHLRDIYNINAYVVGVGSANPELKADWIEKQVEKGYVNIKFMDDSVKNLKAVQTRLANKPINLTLINAITGSETISENFVNKMMPKKSKLEMYIIKEYTPSNPIDIDKAIKEIEKLGVRNPINPKEIVIDNSVIIEVSNWDKRLWFSSLYSTSPGKGNARRIMDKIMAIADKYKVTVALAPEPFGPKETRLTRSQLVKFYKSLGFKFQKGESQFGDMERVAENLDPDTFKDTGNAAPYGSGYSKIKQMEERLNLFLEKNMPTDPAKWSYYKGQAKKKFDVYPSAYANAWAAKKYKAAGGRWRTSEATLKFESNLLKVSKPYEFQAGDTVRNINPSCTHYKSAGEVVYVHDDGDITYVVNNQGATYTPGDELTKSSDQLMKVFMHTPTSGYGSFSNDMM